jgi:hypothetical protein
VYQHLLGASHIFCSRAVNCVTYLFDQGSCNSDPRIDRARIDLESLLEEPLLLLRCCRLRLVGPSPPAHDQVARIGTHHVCLDAALLGPDQLDAERLCETPGDLRLRSREIGALGVEPVGPKVPAGCGIDQLHVYLNLVTGPPHSAFEHIANAELTADLLCVDRFALIGESRVAGDREAAGDSATDQ